MIINILSLWVHPFTVTLFFPEYFKVYLQISNHFTCDYFHQEKQAEKKVSRWGRKKTQLLHMQTTRLPTENPID